MSWSRLTHALSLPRGVPTAEVRKAYRMVTLDHHNAFTTKRARQDYDFRITLLKAKMIEKLHREMRQIETEKIAINTPVAPDPIPQSAPMGYTHRPNSAGSLYPNPRATSASPPKRSAHTPPAVSPRDLDMATLTNSVNSVQKRRRKTPVTSTQYPFVV
jgi:hypothetical protein